MDLTCTDTCCLINLIRGEVLDLAATTLEREICIQGLVEDELKADAEQVRLLVEAGKIRLVSGADLFASEVGIIASSYNLGLGEAECCLALARKVGCSLASDDGKARRTAIAELGKTRVTGSIGMLRDATRRGVLEPDEAYRCYSMMRAAGAFLPPLDADYFSRP